MKYGSLFSGIGGFDLGFDRAGMHCAWQVEIDRHSSEILARHWPNTNRFKDVRHVTGNSVEAVDLICGGFPCQDLSIAGARKGLAGAKSGLWYEYYRLLKELTPRWVVIENVPGLLSASEGRDFADILRGLEKCGYYVAWRVLDSQWFGVPQRRRRCYIIGSLRNGGAGAVLFEQEVGHRCDKKGETTKQNNPARSTGSSGEARRYVPRVSGTLVVNHRGMGRHERDFVIVEADGRVRRLMPIEWERLQGFPDHWTVGQSDGVRYRQLGNAVTVPVAQWIGERIMAVEKQNPPNLS